LLAVEILAIDLGGRLADPQAPQLEQLLFRLLAQRPLAVAQQAGAVAVVLDHQLERLLGLAPPFPRGLRPLVFPHPQLLLPLPPTPPHAPPARPPPFPFSSSPPPRSGRSPPSRSRSPTGGSIRSSRRSCPPSGFPRDT